MDPAELLRAAEALIKDGDIESAKELLDAYVEWRIRGGFEPRGGDAKMTKLNARVEGGGKPTRSKRRKPTKMKERSHREVMADLGVILGPPSAYDVNTPVLCQRCAQRGDAHRVADGACPPGREVKFPRLATSKNPDRALALYWRKGPGTTFLPRR